MNRYLIESPHNPWECEHVLEQVTVMGYITHYDWACEENIHKGYVIIEADTETEALLSVPTFIRPKAKVIKLVKYSPDRFHIIHR